MMKTLRSIAPRLALLLLLTLVTVLGACQSAPLRNPREDYSAAEDYKNRGVADVVVLPIQASTPRRSGESDREQLPAAEMRQMVRTYLIQQKDYAAPKSAWIDGRRERSEGFDTDAVMSVTVDQWDTSSLERRGVIYVSALFELKTEAGEELWRYRCDDMQVAVAGPFGAERTAENVREGARILTETALSRMPRK